MFKIKNIQNFNLFFLSTLIFSLKPLEFLSSNILIANFAQDLIYPVLFHLIIFMIYLIFFFITLKFKNIIFKKFFLLIPTLYYLQFFIIDINFYIDLVIPFNFSESYLKIISLFIIVIVSIIFNNLYFLSKDKYLFVLVALIICLTQISFIIFKSFNNYLTTTNNKDNQVEFIDEKYDLNDIENLNVYYVILDGLTSYDYLSKNLYTDHKGFNEFNNNLKKFNFRIFNNSLSSYNSTYLTLASILEMKYFDETMIYHNRDDFFPNMLYKETPPNLILKLNEIGYEFYYSGNSEIQCKINKNFHCVSKLSDKNSNNIYSKMINFMQNPGIQTYIRNSLINSFLIRLSHNLNFSFDMDALDNFTTSIINSIEPNSNKFYFIHNLSPHPPYPQADCEIENNNSKTVWGTIDEYSIAINCVLKKTQKFIDNVLINDPNAIIVIQADHGPNFTYDFSINPLSVNKESLQEKFSIHNSVKLPPKCDVIKSDSLGNVETINLIFNCLINKKIDHKPLNRSFAGAFEDSSFFGNLVEVTSNLK